MSNLVEAYITNNNIVCKSSLGMNALSWGYDLGYDWFQSISNSLGNNSINNIAKTGMPIFNDFSRLNNLKYESNTSKIEGC